VCVVFLSFCILRKNLLIFHPESSDFENLGCTGLQVLDLQETVWVIIFRPDVVLLLSFITLHDYKPSKEFVQSV
jgi:hypothetical protein